jgi:hypothetical protein
MKREERDMFFQDKSKRGMSVIIGYVLLVTFAIVIGLIVFQWMKSYVPQEDLLCPDGVSVFIKSYGCSSDVLSIILKNNGKFDIGGYFIYATDSPTEELATIDISKNNTDSSSILKPSGIKFGRIASIIPGNTLEPNEEEIEIYNLTGIENLYSIEILPIRWQKEKNRNVIVSCKDAKITEIIKCDVIGEECIEETPAETCDRVNADCGLELSNCFNPVDCGGCTSGNVCNSTGQCIPVGQCGETCASLGWSCGIVCSTELCGECPGLPNSIPVCNTSEGECIISSCNEGWANCNSITSDGCEGELGTEQYCSSCVNSCLYNPNLNCITYFDNTHLCSSCNSTWTRYGETSDVECDGPGQVTNCFMNNCTCMGEYGTSGLGGCKIPSAIVDSCPSYCNTFVGYTNGACMQNPAQCTGIPGPGIYIGDVPEADPLVGNGFCNVGNADTCCCIP